MTSLSLIQGYIIGYFIIIYGIGFFKKSNSDKNSFIFAGRKLTLPAFVATLVSTWYGGILEVGRFSYENGIVTWLVFGVFYYFAAICFSYFLVPKIINGKIQSIPGLIHKTSGKTAGLIAVLLILLLTSPAPYLKIFTVIIRSVWDLPEFAILTAGITMSVFYALKGGFSSIVRTDKLQFILMFTGFGMMLWHLVSNYGGYEFLISNVPANLLEIPGNIPWTTIFAWGFIAMVTFIDPGFFQRSFAGTTLKTVKKGIGFSILFWILFDFMTVTTGLYAAAILPESHSTPYIDLAQIVLSPLAQTIFIISLLAIVMSTIDSFTFISAYTIGMDLSTILKTEIDDQAIYTNTRIGLVLTAFIAVGLSLFFNNAVEMWYMVGSLAVPVLMVPVLSGLYGIKLDRPLLQMMLPLFVTLCWFFIGFLNQDKGGYPQYYFGLDPMYPGIGVSFVLFLMLRK